MIEEILNVVKATDHSTGTTGSTSIRNNDEHNAAATSLTSTAAAASTATAAAEESTSTPTGVAATVTA
jgi:hypothetical protein